MNDSLLRLRQQVLAWGKSEAHTANGESNIASRGTSPVRQPSVRIGLAT